MLSTGASCQEREEGEGEVRERYIYGAVLLKIVNLHMQILEYLL